MIGLAFDENFNGDVLRGLLRRSPHLDVVRVQDCGLSDRRLLTTATPLDRHRGNTFATAAVREVTCSFS